MSKSPKGKAVFEKFYEAQYSLRWPKLLESFLGPSEYEHFHCSTGKVYHLDPASVICAKSLPLFPGCKVLDACAAPGGKSLVLLHSFPEIESIHLNELSFARFNRLKRVISEHCTPELQSKIKLTCQDVLHQSKWTLNSYDCILLDAPCSSERHVYTNSEIETWGPARTKRQAETQLKLLRACTQYLKPGGRLLYSTCSISSLENQGVLAKFQEKQKDMEFVPNSFSLGEELDLGWIFLPDITPGWGPLFLSQWKKLEMK